MAKTKPQLKVATPIRLDIGCGKNKREGFHGVDVLQFDTVDTVLDVRETPWPWADGVVDEVHCSHFVEHLSGAERVPFFNELYRVMKKGARAAIITPDWSNDCAYGDPTHQWPPMSRWYPLYLLKSWREVNAPHCGYICDFDYAIGGGWEPWLEARNMNFRVFAMQYYNNAMRDLFVTLTKR